MSSHEAAALLRFRKKKDRRDKATVDRLAACLILEAFLREGPEKGTSGGLEERP